MSITIADLSRYNPVQDVDLYDGVILNVEDPGFGAKRDRAISDKKPWGTYSWVYPGAGAAAADRAANAGTGPLGIWFDYEQGGVTPGDLQAALARADQLGLKTGVYTYLYIIDSVQSILGNHPLWLAYYPGANDGSYPDGRDGDAVAHGAILWQYTSSNGTRDLSRVLDEARWNAWTGGSPAPVPPPVLGGDAMAIIKENRDGGQTPQYWLPAGGGLVKLSDGEAYAWGVDAKVPVVEYGTLGVVGLSKAMAKANNLPWPPAQ